MASPREANPNAQSYIGVDSDSLNAAAPYVTDGLLNVANWIWDPNALDWVRATSGSVAGATDVNITNASVPISGTVTIGGQPIAVTTAPSGTPSSTFVAGTVTANQGGAPWQVAGSINLNGQPITVLPLHPSTPASTFISGSIAVLPTTPTSTFVTGTVQLLPPALVTPVQFGLSSATLGQKTMALSMPVAVASDQAPFTVDVRATGLSSVTIVPTTPTSTFVAGSVSLNAGTNILGSVNVGGSIAVLSLPPVSNTGRVQTTNPPAQADGTTATLALDNVGKQIVTHFSARGLSALGSCALQGTGETVLVAAGGSTLFHDLVALMICNTHSTFVNSVRIRGALGSSILMTVPAVGVGQNTLLFTRPIEAPGRNMSWTAQLERANPNSVYVSAQVVKLVG